ncbi:MAG: DNA polymerase bacteriophage-type [Candidatus Berkelbacteria bacterium Athens1014_28]|uniref:Type-4 uracil-DNA glycosylase n=1 Tax=Candidatus Berkelbacteria bacterium Athens1014_28 TaxID=2017145 RepID=A0A554LLY1_9BACT|nr:MAG: DNA polymerase bacteriophage-type [Candidatus Berkelbacteria bacterium Athens1014_28]
MNREEKIKKLDELQKEVSGCGKCSLSKTRTQTVFGEGDPDSEIFFVGEAPGYNEDQQGIPFCGAAGKFLDQLLASIELDRNKVYIANTLKCRPPDNRDPEPEEKTACRDYLTQQVEIISPKIIITMGRHSTETYLPGIGGITKTRAKLFRRPNGRFYFPLYHPAAALHNGSLRRTLEDDFKKIPEAIKKVKAELEKVVEKVEEKKVKNLKLF